LKIISIFETYKKHFSNNHLTFLLTVIYDPDIKLFLKEGDIWNQ